MKPPSSLLQPCVEPMITPAKTVRDLANNSLSREAAFQRCALQVDCLIAWYDGKSCVIK